jgi:cytochrome P450
MDVTETSSIPPGPKGSWLLGNLPDFKGDLLGFLTRCAREHGDIVSLRLGTTPAVLLNHPDQIEQVLVSRHAEFIKYRFFWRHVTRVFGNGLLTSAGDLWRQQHALMAPAFRQERLDLSVDEITGCANRLLGSWRDGEERDIRSDMTRLTVEIAAKVLFDVELGRKVDTISRAVDRGMEEIDKRFTRGMVIPDWIPTPGNRRYLAIVRDLDEVAANILAERQAPREGRGDLLSTLLQGRDSEGRSLDAQLLRDEIVTLLLAGHETTALALTWTLYLLSRHPEIAARVEEEIDAVLGPERLPRAADLGRLRYLGWVIMEAMRLYPPGYLLGREAAHDVDLGGYRFSRGTICLMSQWVVHRDLRFFPEPELFKPERWDKAVDRQRPRFAYFPFSGGPRICIGQPLAMIEAKLVLAMLCQRFRLIASPGAPVGLYPSVTLRPDPPVRLFVSRRVPAQATLSS